MVIEPGNNINGAGNTANKTRSGTGSTRDTAAPNAPKNNEGDNVSLSNTAQSLSRLEAALSSVPEVDAERVAKIKALVDSGGYQVNAQNLASKIIAQDEF